MKDSFLDEKLVEKAKEENISTFLDRVDKQTPCIFGVKGVCCRICLSGPCRVVGELKGVCGADADTVVARNLLRSVAGGASCHVDHAREITLALLDIAEGKTISYEIGGKKKLRELAKKLGVKASSEKDLARGVALEALEEFRRQEGVFHESEGEYSNWLRIHALPSRISLWKNIGILPISGDYEISHALHVTTMGNESEPTSLLLKCLRIGLVDGYMGLHLSSDLQDVIFGEPKLVETEANLGVLKEDHVNVAVHGHVPLLSAKVVEYAKKMEEKARKVGAEGINVVGICCTGHEILERHGIHLAAHVLQAEFAIVTGALEVLVADMQCIFPSLSTIAGCYHTKIITTANARISGAMYMPFTVENADEIARRMIEIAIENFKSRDKSRVYIPKKKAKLYAGFSDSTLLKLFSSVENDNPINVLVSALESGEVKGICAVVGCRNPRLKGEKFVEKMIKELLKEDVWVITTGCIAHSAAQEGLMNPSALKFCGSGLRKFLREVGRANSMKALPPVLHFGSCVDNSRIEKFWKKIAEFLNTDFSSLPLVASAPELLTEKSVAIGMWLLCLGIPLHLNIIPPISGSNKVLKFFSRDVEKLLGSYVVVANDPVEAAKCLVEAIEKRRKKLNW